MGGQNFLLPVGSFFNKREYSEADWLVPLIFKKIVCLLKISRILFQKTNTVQLQLSMEALGRSLQKGSEQEIVDGHQKNLMWQMKKLVEGGGRQTCKLSF